MIETYLYLTELYQYRKSDTIKALSSITTATQVILDNPEVQIRNLYFYINLGNVLFQYNLFDDAIFAYKESLERNDDLPFAKVLALNNIALSYQALHVYDSARYFFGKANEAIPDKKDMMMAQNYNYINTLMLENKQLDSIQYYHQLVEDLVHKVDLRKFAKDKSDSLNAQVEILKIIALSTLTVGQFYDLTGIYGKADSCYRKVLRLAETHGFIKLEAKSFSKLAGILEKQGQTETALQLANSALKTNLKLRNFVSVIETAKLLSGLNARIGNVHEAAKYLKLARAYSDSLRNRTIADTVLNNKLFLTGANTKLAIKDLRHRQAISSKIIDQQQMIIYLMVLVGLITMISVIFVRISRKRIKKANLNLARRTMEVVASETIMRGSPTATDPKRNNDILVLQLDQLLRTEKIYMDQNLTLASLAEKLGSNTSYLSRVINDQHKLGFNDFINEYRVKEACRLLMTINDRNITIDHILSNSGFSSRSPFYSAFKKFTGVTPEVFKRMNQL